VKDEYQMEVNKSKTYIKDEEKKDKEGCEVKLYRIKPSTQKYFQLEGLSLIWTHQ
jgi:hypothetical protein